MTGSPLKSFLQIPTPFFKNYLQSPSVFPVKLETVCANFRNFISKNEKFGKYHNKLYCIFRIRKLTT